MTRGSHKDFTVERPPCRFSVSHPCCSCRSLQLCTHAALPASITSPEYVCWCWHHGGRTHANSLTLLLHVDSHPSYTQRLPVSPRLKLPERQGAVLSLAELGLPVITDLPTARRQVIYSKPHVPTPPPPAYFAFSSHHAMHTANTRKRFETRTAHNFNVLHLRVVKTHPQSENNFTTRAAHAFTSKTSSLTCSMFILLQEKQWR